MTDLRSDPVVTTLFYKFQGILKTETITTSTIISLVTQLIPIIQKMVVGDKRGQYKKQVLMTVLGLLVEEADPAKQEPLQNIIDATVPVMVDTMVSIANGEINLLGKDGKTCCNIA